MFPRCPIVFCPRMVKTANSKTANNEDCLYNDKKQWFWWVLKTTFLNNDVDKGGRGAISSSRNWNSDKIFVSVFWDKFSSTLRKCIRLCVNWAPSVTFALRIFYSRNKFCEVKYDTTILNAHNKPHRMDSFLSPI